MESPDSKRIRCCYEATPRDAAKLKKECVVPFRKTKTNDNDRNNCELKSMTSNKVNDVNYDSGDVRNFIPTEPCIKLAVLRGIAEEAADFTTPTSDKDDATTDDEDYDPYYGDLRTFVANNCVQPLLDISLLKGSDFSSDSAYESETNVAANDGGDEQE